MQVGIVVHTFKLSSWEGEAGRSFSSKPAWSTECQDSLGYSMRQDLKIKTNKRKIKSHYPKDPENID